jgi:hypothetical protein
VATYDDYRRAIAAVEHLRSEGLRAGVDVVLSQFQTTRVRADNPVSDELRRTIVPAVAAALAGTVALELLDGLPAALTLLAAVAAVVATLCAFAVAATRASDGHGCRATHALVPARYEIRADPSVAPRAERLLARWWQTGLDGPPRTPLGRRANR